MDNQKLFRMAVAFDARKGIPGFKYIQYFYRNKSVEYYNTIMQQLNGEMIPYLKSNKVQFLMEGCRGCFSVHYWIAALTNRVPSHIMDQFGFMFNLNTCLILIVIYILEIFFAIIKDTT
jgi:hypothetical protein